MGRKRTVSQTSKNASIFTAQFIPTTHVRGTESKTTSTTGTEDRTTVQASRRPTQEQAVMRCYDARQGVSSRERDRTT